MERAEIHELSAAYALHALDPDELEAFEEHLGHCRECREAVASFQAAAAALAYEAESPAPPPDLKGRILADVRRDGREEQAVVVPFPRRRWAFPVAAAAAFAASAAALALAFWAGDLSRQLDEERAAQHLADETVAFLADGDARRVPLEGAEGLLVVHDDTGEAWLVLLDLARAPDSKTYEAWVIDGGDPVPAALFAGGGESTIVPLQTPVSADALVAVTVEDEGGADQPTQDPFIIAGEAR